MTDADRALLARMSSDLAAITAYLARASADVRQLELSLGERSTQPQPHVQPQVQPQPQPQVQSPPRSEGWIVKALAVAGVMVTLVGVALLLVLAAQAGLLRPEFRVLAGAALAGGLVVTATRLRRRPGGRVGSIALAATGVAAAYIDVIAVTTIYRWVAPPGGLMIAAIVAVSGLLLARRWDSEQLGLLVLVPLIGLGPVVADGVTLPLVGFMLALSAAAVPVQLGRDWLGLHAARIATSTLPLGVALILTSFDSARSPMLAAACAFAVALAMASTLLLLPSMTNATAMALLTAVGTTPVLAAALVIDRVPAALMAAALSAVLLLIVLAGSRLPMVTAGVRSIWSVLAAVAGLVAVTVAFDGPVAGPILLAMAVVVAVGGRREPAARWCAAGFGIAGGLCLLGYAPPSTLVTATAPEPSIAVSTLVGSALLTVCAVVLGSAWRSGWSWVIAAAVALYGITMFTVSTGVLIGGVADGFFAGHVVATVCWIALAAAVLRHAARVTRTQRSLPIAGGMAIVAAAVVKLFLFDLGTLDGIFRVVVFIVVGLALLAMGAGYARLLAQQDDREMSA